MSGSYANSSQASGSRKRAGNSGADAGRWHQGGYRKMILGGALEVVGIICRTFLAGALGIAGVYKILHPSRTADSLRRLGRRGWPSTPRALARCVGVTEGGLAILLATSWFGPVGVVGGFVFTVCLIPVLFRLAHIAPAADCGCYPPGLSPTSLNRENAVRLAKLRNVMLAAAAGLLLTVEMLKGQAAPTAGVVVAVVGLGSALLILFAGRVLDSLVLKTDFQLPSGKDGRGT